MHLLHNSLHNQPVPNQPTLNQPVPNQPVPNLPQPFLYQPVPQIIHEQMINWSYFKPKFAGRPQEDAVA